MDAIRTEALTKHYKVGFWRPRPYPALDALTLQVERGEVFGFLGPNGAGKTTTLKLLVQLMYPSSGRAEILGRPAGDVDVKRRIGYLPEQPYFYDYLTAEELLEYFAAISAGDLRNFETGVESPVAGSLTRVLYYVLPNFSAFDVKTRVVYGESIDVGYVSLTALYGVTYVALVLVAAVTNFSRRDF